jgi:predicted cupin superfamily sugar epimerase
LSSRFHKPIKKNVEIMKHCEIIELLGLKKLEIEGGYYHESYRCEVMTAENGIRSCGTCIYYLLKGDSASRWHKVKSDEIWLYHCGSPALQDLLFPDGRSERRIISNDLAGGARPQSIVPKDVWQTTILNDDNPESWGLFSTVVCPGFEFEDYTPLG